MAIKRIPPEELQDSTPDELAAWADDVFLRQSPPDSEWRKESVSVWPLREGDIA